MYAYVYATHHLCLSVTDIFFKEMHLSVPDFTLDAGNVSIHFNRRLSKRLLSTHKSIITSYKNLIYK